MPFRVRLTRPFIGLLAASLVAFGVGAGVAAPPSHAAETGVNAVGLSFGQGTALASAVSAKWVRGFARWDMIEPNGPDRWSPDQIAALDELTQSARDRGLKVLLVVSGSPHWANNAADPFVPPADPGEYGRFLRALSARYRGLVTAWEIWNEPDGVEFWKGAPPSAGAYLPLLQAAFKGIRGGDPGAKVLAAPATGNDYPFLEGIYAAGGKGSFDGVAVHTDTACLIKAPNDYYRGPDGRIGQFSFLGFREMHAVMAANGDGDKPIIMSEIGWSTSRTPCARGQWAGQKASGVSEAQQAANLKLAFRCLSFYPYVEAALWFSAQDYGAPDTELNRYGLLRFDGSKRPSYDALAGIGRHGPPTTGDCGDFQAPSIKVMQPTVNAYFDRSLPIRVSASDAPGKLGRISLYANGNKIRSFTKSLKNDRVVGLEWMGARNLPYGKVTLTVEALDQWGNVTRRDVQVERVNPAALPPQKTVFSKLKVTGKGLKRTVKGRLTSLGPFPPDGKVKLEWQYRRGSKWVTLHKKTKNANRPFVYRQRLARKGRWRLKASYVAVKPFAATSAIAAFRAR